MQKETILLASTVPFLLSEHETERDAVLLECCELPDKKLTLTEADLDGIAARFAGNVPIKLQHIDSPLDPFGVVKSVQRVGKQLFGKISFPPAIAGLVRERGAAALSCGLDRDPLKLSEVSLVLKGRIPAATLLADDERTELERLRLETTAQRVDAQIVQLKLAGKILPATEAAARVLLAAPDSSKIVLTDGQSLSTAEAFTAFLSALPPLVTLGELKLMSDDAIRAGQTHNTPGMITEQTFSQEERDWMERALGVKPSDVAKTMEADRKTKAASEAATGKRGMM